MEKQTRTIEQQSRRQSLHSVIGQIKRTLSQFEGRKWDEISHELKTKYPQYAKQLFGSVGSTSKLLEIGTQCLVKNNKLQVKNEFNEWVNIEDANCVWYIDADTKSLTKNKFLEERIAKRHQARQKAFEQASANRRVLSEQITVIKSTQGWTVLSMAQWDSQNVFDPYLKKRLDARFDKDLVYSTYGVSNKYCTECRELNHQEQLKLGLI